MIHKVSLHHLKLTDFRNYADLSLTLDDRHVVLTGDNGSGKTNLMEAVSLLSPGRGLRRSVYSDIVRVGAPNGFSVFAEIDGMLGKVAIGTGVEAAEEGQVRKLRLNGTPAKAIDELLDHLRIVWLTPSMDGLFTGGASDRRRFIDRLVLSLDPAHGRRAIDFEKAMRMRNKLLEEGKFDPVWLEGIERQMAQLGVAMALARNEMISLLIELGKRRPDDRGFPTAGIELSGFLDGQWQSPSIDLEDRYCQLLQAGRYRDQAAGRTLEGPHRADMMIRHRQKDMDAARCSTGEQKALLVGLILAHASLVATMTGHAPLLLLDEIAAHLDEARRAALFDMIDALGGQAFMTGTDPSMFAALGSRAQFLAVANGRVMNHAR